MILWVFIAVLTVVAIAIIALPLIKDRGTTSGADHQAEVYDDQIAEIQRDLERGVLTDKEAENMRAEVNRRMTQLAAMESSESSAGSFQFRSVSLIAISALLPIGALATYANLGSPNLPDAPFAERPIAKRTATATNTPAPNGPATADNSQDLHQLIDGLVVRLKQNPNDLNGWLLLARSYFQVRDFAQAADAFGKAYGLAPKRADIAAAYGEMQVIRDRGQFSDGAREAFRAAYALDAAEPRTLFYQGVDLAAQGKHREAIQNWVDLKTVSQPGAPWLAPLETRMATSAKTAGIDPTTVSPRVEKPGPGPSRAQLEAAQQMSPQERVAMVQAMVRALAAKMEEDPNDLAGWQRLAKAYRVLGQLDKANAAEARMIAIQQKRGGGPPQSTAAAPHPQPSAAAPRPPRAPTQEEISAAKRMSPRDRVQMIEGMVNRLAERLKENPNDLAGWQQLARSYQVMGRSKKAREAQARIEELQKKLGTSQQPAAPRGPSSADVEAAQQMAPADRAQMIRGMVERLAERLKDNPDDLAGWQRLTRAYRVMGETDKANQAQSRVDALLKSQ